MPNFKPESKYRPNHYERIACTRTWLPPEGPSLVPVPFRRADLPFLEADLSAVEGVIKCLTLRRDLIELVVYNGTIVRYGQTLHNIRVELRRLVKDGLFAPHIPRE